MTNGEHPAATPHAQATPADGWPVPLTPGPAYVHSSVLAGRDEHGRRINLIRLEVYTAAGAAVVYLEATEAIVVFGQALQLARAAKTGLHLPT